MREQAHSYFDDDDDDDDENGDEGNFGDYLRKLARSPSTRPFARRECVRCALCTVCARATRCD
jgi:hypothetical protein